MEDGDSDTDKYPHRTGNIAGSDELYGIIGASPPTPLLKGKSLSPTPPQKGRGFLVAY